MKHRSLPTLLVLAALLIPRVVHAEADARDYEGLSAAPNHTVAVWNYLRHITQSTKQDLTTNAAVFRATYILRFGNFSFIPFDAALTVADATLLVPLSPTASQPRGSIHETGIGDLQYFPTLGYNFVENAENGTHTYGGVTAFLKMPTGNYSSSNFFNIGQNRWTFKPQLFVGQRFAKVFTAEAVGNVEIYGNNTSYYVPTAPQIGKQTLKQDPSYNLELHLAADVHATMWVGTTLYVGSNGAQNFDLATAAGTMNRVVDKHGVVETARFTWGIHIEKQTLLLLQFNQDLNATGGSANQRFFGARVSHYFW